MENNAGKNKSAKESQDKVKLPKEESGIALYASTENVQNIKCLLVAQQSKFPLKLAALDPKTVVDIPRVPALREKETVIFGANRVCCHLIIKTKSSDLKAFGGYLPPEIDELLDAEEFVLGRYLKGNSSSSSSDPAVLIDVLKSYEDILTKNIYPPNLTKFIELIVSCTLLEILPKIPGTLLDDLKSNCPTALLVTETIGKSPEYLAASETLATFNKSTSAATALDIMAPDVIPVAEISELDGVQGMLRAMFTNAIRQAFPLAIPLGLDAAVITKCGNPANGDYQFNNAMALTKALKSVANYKGPTSPRDTAVLIEKAIAYPNPLIGSTSTAPNGFINISISREAILENFKNILVQGTRNTAAVAPKNVLVDFSSPNIAKEMHVGHLRSTIIGDAVCRILEFCGHNVMRINHVGDWGTQFGMLITYLQDAYPDILTNPPNISDLTVIYKASKKRFDEEPLFKERARTAVVSLQSGDAACRAIWTVLCDISRKEFQNVYDILQVDLKEVGESFYNPMIPATIEELKSRGYVIDEEGMLIIKLPHFEIPLIVRKSDGGYGYDSTDLTAIRYRLKELNRDWIIYITDEGQGNHFRMCFDVAKAIGWASEDKHRLDHIGFGVVCGDDGKRLKTRSAEGNVRLIDLLDEARVRMYAALNERNKEGKNTMSPEELDHAARVIGYGAVKYFDLKQHPATNYIFSFDRMLDTKGDTAVYLLFAYARVTSILNKAEDVKKVSIAGIIDSLNVPDFTSRLDLVHPAEKALLFEIFQFGDMIRSVLLDLLPNRLCDYLKEISVKFTDFVTRCHVLNSKEEGESAETTMNSRLLLCEATRRIMETCFHLLGIGTLNRI